MVTASLAWSLKAWSALLVPVSPRHTAKHVTEERTLLRCIPQEGRALGVATAAKSGGIERFSQDKRPGRRPPGSKTDADGTIIQAVSSEVSLADKRALQTGSTARPVGTASGQR
ncbi:hypothetical protein Sinac_0538 [Singulisphaera acidiphila DSM 18658]|uniref:Uncharacterized protein n=1 Tax=Singulisphaera acidiphila (strain ATCC BAA-1392 / DSM 18658 / VKM B-2454 / MOB10) TaxID=886293 RepID=L0D6V4_SINAD|nr:hypothetical protein Sinac_0538 [Singulisphaera acidiphila DSM 18658]